VAAIMQMASGLPPLPANVVIFGVLYTTAAYGARRTFWLGLASSLVGAVAIAVYIVVVPLLLGAGTPNGIGTYVFASVATFASAAFALLLSWTTGALVRTTLRAREPPRAGTRRGHGGRRGRAHPHRPRHARRRRPFARGRDRSGRRRALRRGIRPGRRRGDARHHLATARAALSDVRMLLTQLRHTQAEGPQPTLADLEQLYAQVRAAGVALRVDIDPMPAAEVPRRCSSPSSASCRRRSPMRCATARAEVSVRLAWHPGRVELSVSNPIDPPSPLAAAHGDRGRARRADTGSSACASAHSSSAGTSRRRPAGRSSS
jgi:hypothetical protein